MARGRTPVLRHALLAKKLGELPPTVRQRLQLSALDGWTLESPPPPPGWLAALGGAHRDADAGRWSEVGIGAFASALASLLGPASAVLTEAHAHVLARLYGATRGGRKASAPEMALRILPRITKKGVALSQQLADGLAQLVQDLEGLGLIRRTGTQQIRWVPLTLVHLPPGQGSAAPA